MINNVGYALAVEKMCDIQVTDRCQWYRDDRWARSPADRRPPHVRPARMAMELGAFTPFLWFLKAREILWDDLLEEETGARLTQSFGRIGGMAQAADPAASKQLCLERFAAQVVAPRGRGGEDAPQEPHLPRPPRARRAHLAAMMPSRLSWTGPCLRASGRRVRRSQGASRIMKYDEVEFDVPVGKNGDTPGPLPRAPRRDPSEPAHPRCRCLDRMADDGPDQHRRPARHAPRKGRTSTRRSKGPSSHFKLIMEGAKVPAGEALFVHRSRQRRARVLPRQSDGSGHAVPRFASVRRACAIVERVSSKLRHRAR